MACSSSGVISSPSGPENLMPLKSVGLCDAVTMRPRRARSAFTLNCRHGVGMLPSSTTSTPSIARTPARIRAMPGLVVR